MKSIRHPVLSPAVVSLAAVIYGSACSPSDDRSETSPVPAAIVISIPADPTSLFPPKSQTTTDDAISSLIYRSLARIGPALNTVGDEGFVPDLAVSWERIDSLTWEFELDSSARWEDGKRVTAADVAYTFDVYRDGSVASFSEPLLAEVVGVTALGESRVRFRFSHLYAEQFHDATYHMRILPEHLLGPLPLDDSVISRWSNNPVGSGPYQLSG